VSGEVRRRAFQAADLGELVRFALDHPATDADEGQARTVLGRLPRSTEHVIDLEAGGARVLVASVLDALKNASDSALLAVLGYQDGAEGGRAVALALEIAEEIVRRGPRRRLEVPLPGGLRRHAPILEGRGYAPAFVQLRMARDAAPEPAAPPPLDEGFRWVDLEEEHVAGYHALAAAAFAGIQGSHVAEPGALRAALLEAPIRPRLLLREGRIAGIARIGRTGEAGVIQLIGRDPALRGERLGDHLVVEAMRALRALGARRLELEVNADNGAAIALYRRHGFEVEDQEPTYRIELDG
jgi:ribosomal protein S18 acetylase RimI-like enzyme